MDFAGSRDLIRASALAYLNATSIVKISRRRFLKWTAGSSIILGASAAGWAWLNEPHRVQITHHALAYLNSLNRHLDEQRRRGEAGKPTL